MDLIRCAVKFFWVAGDINKLDGPKSLQERFRPINRHWKDEGTLPLFRWKHDLALLACLSRGFSQMDNTNTE